MHAANVFLANSGFETASLAGWATFGPDDYGQSGAGVANGGFLLQSGSDASEPLFPETYQAVPITFSGIQGRKRRIK
jgi:hypothetical protein